MRKLEEIIREYYIESLGASQLDQRYARFLQIAISGLRDLHMDIKSIETDVVLTVNENQTVDLPSDYIDYLVIGQIRGGIVFSLGLNNNVAPLSTDDCGNQLSSATVNQDGSNGEFISYNSTSYNQDGQFTGRKFGLGGGGSSIGTYKVFKDKGYIALSNYGDTEILLRYLSNLEKVDGNFMVDDFMVEAVKAWMYWRYIQRMRSYSPKDKKDAKDFYFSEKKKANRRVHNFNIPEFLNSYNSGVRSAPRM